MIVQKPIISRSLPVIAASLALWAPGATAQPQQLFTNDSDAARPLPAFHARRDFPGIGGAAPAQGDLNGDGILDLAVGGAGLKRIAVLLGNSDGTFRPPNSINAGAVCFSIAIADLNGDGFKDIAAATSSGISIILGESGGNFGAPTIIPAGKNPERIIVADLNQDRIPDLAVANFDSNDVSIFFGKGDGTFTEAATIPVGMAPFGLAVGDFNGDGQIDLAVSDSGIHDGVNNGSNPNTVAVLLGTGSGTFLPPAFIATRRNPEGIAVGDFNKDGKADLAVVLSATDQVAVMLGNGDGSFQSARVFTVFPQSQPEPGTGFGAANVELADFNGDGKVDLAVANTLTSTVGVLFGDGSGNFNSPRNIEVSRTPVWVLTGDYNHDGKPDFVSSNADASTVSVVLGNGDGTFLNAPSFLLGGQPRKLLTADFNEDGRPDLASIGGFGNTPGNTVSVLLNKSAEGFAPNVTTLNADLTALAAADVDQDGHMDLVGANFGTLGTDTGGITVMLGRGDGTFQPARNIPVGVNPALVAVADFNSDGKPDAVISNFVFTTSVSSLSFVPGNGNGGFGSPSTVITFPQFTQLTQLLTGDFQRRWKNGYIAFMCPLPSTRH
ncbi:MAG: VCBS repeat-containing protein [Bryobacteraceae bacterium]